MIQVFKFATEEFKSPGLHGEIDYSGPYPKVIEEQDFDPSEKGPK
jgi:hypothetical protein